MKQNNEIELIKTFKKCFMEKYKGDRNLRNIEIFKSKKPDKYLIKYLYFDRFGLEEYREEIIKVNRILNKYKGWGCHADILWIDNQRKHTWVLSWCGEWTDDEIELNDTKFNKCMWCDGGLVTCPNSDGYEWLNQNYKQCLSCQKLVPTRKGD